MLKPTDLSVREREILARSLRTWADLERTAGNAIAARLLDDLHSDFDRTMPVFERPVVAFERPYRYVDDDGIVRVRRDETRKAAS